MIRAKGFGFQLLGQVLGRVWHFRAWVSWDLLQRVCTARDGPHTVVHWFGTLCVDKISIQSYSVVQASHRASRVVIEV